MAVATIALVSCVKSKRSEPCPAEDLYISALFRYARAYAERQASRWFILSAKHGLVTPETVLAPYEETLNNMSVHQRREWADRVYKQMNDAGLLADGMRFLWLAGMAYQRELSKKLAKFEQTDPLAGFPIGRRLSWLKQATAAPAEG